MRTNWTAKIDEEFWTRKWCFNRLILAQSRQFWRNVNFSIANLPLIWMLFGDGECELFAGAGGRIAD